MLAFQLLTEPNRRFAMSTRATPAFSAAKSLILTQHQELRRVLRTGALLAGAASRGDGPCLEELPNLIESLWDKFVEHVSFEDVTLVPVLRRGDPRDLERAQQLLKEHEKQRGEFAMLLALARSSGDPETVAYSFQGLLNALLTDMDEEEKWLLQAGGDTDAKPLSAEHR
jgi:iron-sulfur cluster repair protein YtfE (RIC family)